jgi:hypothetical protein
VTTESQNPVIIYEDANKAVEVWLDKDQETVWLTQAQMAELFDVKPQNITMHLKNVYGEGELAEEATCKESLHVQLCCRNATTRVCSLIRRPSPAAPCLRRPRHEPP